MAKRVIACALIVALSAVGGSAASAGAPVMDPVMDLPGAPPQASGRVIERPVPKAANGSAQRMPLADQLEAFRNARRTLRELEPGARQNLCSTLVGEPEAVESSLQELAQLEQRLVEVRRGVDPRTETDSARALRAAELVGKIRPWTRSLRTGKAPAVCTPVETSRPSALLDPVPAAPPANDGCASAVAVGNGLFSGATIEATNDGSATCGSSSSSPDVWYRYTAPATGWVTFDLQGPGYDTVLSLHSACPGTTANQLACNDDYGTGSRIDYSVMAGTAYLVRVTGYGGDSGSYDLDIAPLSVSISGTVTDSGTTDPLEYLEVDIFDSVGSFVGYAYTDSNGSYTVPSLADGTYYARTWNYRGYVDEIYDDVACPFSCTPTVGKEIVVSGGGETGGIDFALDLGGTLSGTVTDVSSSAPVPGWVRLYDSTGLWVGSEYIRNGLYEFDGLPTATYFVRTDNQGGYFEELYDDIDCSSSCSVLSGTPVAVTLGAATQGIDFALVKGGTISGTITDSVTGIPLMWNVQARIYSASGVQIEATWSDNYGSYTSPKGLATGTYHVRTHNSIGWNDELYDDLPCVGGSCTVTSGTPVAVTSGADTSGIDFALANPGGVITGQVTDAVVGTPIPWVEVDIYDSGGGFSAYGYADASGNYLSWENLASGTYHAITWNYWGYPDELYNDLDCSSGCDPTTGTPIAVSSYTTGIDFGLEKSGAISGQITDATSGTPLAGFEVDIYDSGGSYAGYGYTDATGRYISTGELAPGTYYARTVNTAGYLDELYDDIPCVPHYSCDPTAGTPIAVASYATGIDFALALGGSVSGTVTQNGTGTPIKDVLVQVYDSDGYSSSDLTDASGNYTVFGLATGDHYACTSNELGYVNERYDDMPVGTGWCNPTAGTAIAVTAPADTGGIDFALSLGGSISGTVTEEGTGTPIPDVSIYIYDSSGTWASGVYSDAAGSYTAASLPSGTFYACAFDYNSNHIGERYDDMPIGTSWCDPTSGTPITVTAPADTGGIDFALALGGGIAGTVTADGSGAPIQNVRVRVYNTSGDSVASDWTDGAGHYAIGSLSSGTYYACTWNSLGFVNERYDDMPVGTGWCHPTSGTPIVVAAPAETGSIDFALAVGGSVSGTITADGTGMALEDVYVTIYDSSDSYTSYGYTDAAGAYTADRLPTGTYYACTSNSLGYLNELYDDIPFTGWCNATSGTPIVVTAPADTGGIDFALGLGGSISGTVSEDGSGTPIPDVEVEIFDSSGSYVTYAYTDAVGAYMASHLPTGTYYACAYEYHLGYLNERYDNMPFSGSCNPTAGTPISVIAPADTGSIDFALVKGGSISGTVTQDGTGTPIQHVDVNFYDSGGSYVGDVNTDAGGAYAASGVPAGTYYACAYDYNYGHIAERYDNMPIGGGGSCNPTSGTAIVVTAPNDTGGIDFALSLGGSISGTVTEDGTGTPIEDVWVQVYDSSGSYATAGYTDAAGSYSAGSLPSGTYYSCTYPTSSGHIGERYDGTTIGRGSCNPTAGTAIGVVAPANTGGINFSLAPGGWISGSVVEVGTGTPITTAGVDIYDASGTYFGYGYTDASGNFSGGGLPTGTYYAVSDEWTGVYWDEAFDNLPCAPYCDETAGMPLPVIQPAETVGVDFALQWLDGCRPDLFLDGPPTDDSGLNLEGCNSVEILGPFGIEAPGDVTITSGGDIGIGGGFFVDAGASAVFVSSSAARWLRTIPDEPSPIWPGYVDVDAIRVSFVAPSTVRIEFDMRGPLLPGGDPELGSVFYRAWVDLEPPFPSYADFADAEFAWEIRADGTFNYVTAGPGVSPTVSIDGDRITLEADISALAGANPFGLFVDVVDFDAAGSPADQTTGRPILLPLP